MKGLLYRTLILRNSKVVEKQKTEDKEKKTEREINIQLFKMSYYVT